MLPGLSLEVSEDQQGRRQAGGEAGGEAGGGPRVSGTGDEIRDHQGQNIGADGAE